MLLLYEGDLDIGQRNKRQPKWETECSSIVVVCVYVFVAVAVLSSINVFLLK